MLPGVGQRGAMLWRCHAGKGRGPGPAPATATCPQSPPDLLRTELPNWTLALLFRGAPGSGRAAPGSESRALGGRGCPRALAGGSCLAVPGSAGFRAGRGRLQGARSLGRSVVLVTRARLRVVSHLETVQCSAGVCGSWGGLDAPDSLSLIFFVCLSPPCTVLYFVLRMPHRYGVFLAWTKLA